MSAAQEETTAAPPRLAGQKFPFPDELADIVSKIDYRPGWTFRLAHMSRDFDAAGNCISEGLTVDITALQRNAYPPHEDRRTRFLFPVPPATYVRGDWERWLYDRLLDIERHEVMESMVVDGYRPFAPIHAPGHDPYFVRMETTDLLRRTQFTGEVKPT